MRVSKLAGHCLMIAVVLAFGMVQGAWAVDVQKTEPPKLSDSQKLAIRIAQLTLAATMSKMQDSQLQVTDAQRQIAEAQARIAEAKLTWPDLTKKYTEDKANVETVKAAALKDLKISPTDYDFDESLNLIPKPKTAAPAESKK